MIRFVPILALALACGSEPVDVGSSTAALSLTGPGCEPGRRVGIPTRTRGACPAPSPRSGWTVSYLFQDPAAINDGGNPFCLYEYVGNPASFTTATLPIDPGTGDLGVDWTDADCLGVVALAPDPADIVAPAHIRASQRQMGRPDELPQVNGLPDTVHVAVLDSSVDSGLSETEPTTGEFLHGRAVSMTNRDLTCPRGRSGTCIPDFDSYLVLDEGGDPAIPGGHYGRVSTLATTIEQAIIDAGGANLIIPLAVGWHERFNHRDGDPLQPEANTVKAVRAVLEYALCQEVLVLAAAGNRTSDDDKTGAVCPACWEEEIVLCDDQRPLVYAVGGVRPNGEPLAISRELGQPPLVAPADSVSAENVIGSVSGPTLGTWTGTSMGVAHVGAAATLVWGYMPHLNPREVMAHVADAATTVAPSADICMDHFLGNSCGPVRRVTACDTLQAVLSPTSPVCSSGHCPDRILCGAEPSAVADIDEETIDLLLSLANEDAVIDQSLGDPITSAACSAPVTGDGIFDPNQLYCAWETEPSYASEPVSLDAQPGSDPCGACAVIRSKTDYVYMAIQNDMIGILTEPTLVESSVGYVALADAMPPNMVLQAGDVVSVPLQGVQPTYSGGAQLTFNWQKTQGAPIVQVSVDIPVY